MLLEDSRVVSYHMDGPQDVDRGQHEIYALFEGAGDVIELQPADRELVLERLELEWRKDRALVLMLLLLNRNSDTTARRLAVEDLEYFLSEEEVVRFVTARLFSAPLPDSADQVGSRILVNMFCAHRLNGFLEQLFASQDAIRRCRAVWDGIPVPRFGSQSEKDAFTCELILAGMFYRIAEAAPAKLDGELKSILGATRFHRFRNWRDLLSSWITQLNLKAFELKPNSGGFVNFKVQRDAIKNFLVSSELYKYPQFSRRISISYFKCKEPSNLAIPHVAEKCVNQFSRRS